MADAARTASLMRPLRFGPAGRYELRPAEYRLLIDGQPATLGGRALDLLFLLASRPGELFTKNELLEQVWPGVIVEENNLRVQVNSLRKLLGDELVATVPGRGYRFAASVAADDAPAEAAAPPAPVALPPPRPPAAAGPRLFGRDADLARLEGLLGASGCVTLVGPSGVGKTSLARALLARHRAGADALGLWVDLTPLADRDAIAMSMARALEAKLGEGDPVEPLRQALGTQPLLLVLDNAEHLVGACAELLAQLGMPPGLRLLVTSQVPLGLAGERVQRLEPLPLHSGTAPAEPGPPGEMAALGGALGSLGDGAIALLVERIVAADSRFVPTPAGWPLLVDICTQLDGLPLALEMAAARVPVMGLQGVRDGLAQRFSLLTKGRRDAAARHQTLRNAIDWSYRLLQPEEQSLFRALGVFAGGFTLDLVVAVAANGIAPDDPARWDTIDRLTTLVERSLVRVDAGEPPRYRLLDSMRAFAAQRLAESADEQAVVRRRHAAALAALFDTGPELAPDRVPALVAEMPNAREALAWAREHDLGLAARLSAGVVAPNAFTPWQHEVGQWMRGLLAPMASPVGEALPARVQAEWWTEMARAMNFGSNTKLANQAARRAVDLWSPLQSPRRAMIAAMVWVRAITEQGAELDEACAALQAWAARATDASGRERLLVSGTMAMASHLRGDHDAVLASRRAEVAGARDMGFDRWAEAAESNVAYTLNILGRHAEAAETLRLLLARIDAADGDDSANLPWVLGHYIDALVALGRGAQAQALVKRAHAVGQRIGTPTVLPCLPALAVALGRFEAAALLVGHARQGFAAAGSGLDPMEERQLARATAEATRVLGEDAVASLVERGRALRPEAAVALLN